MRPLPLGMVIGIASGTPWMTEGEIVIGSLSIKWICWVFCGLFIVLNCDSKVVCPHSVLASAYE